jgi:hypothetical protein
MNSYQITETGTPIVPYTISITAPVNVSQELINSITVPYATNTQEFTDTLTAYTLNAENAYKTLSEFTKQDTNRNGTYTYINTGGITYNITMTWTIENAEIQLEASTTTDLQDTALNSYLQILADNTVDNYKNQWGWISL